MLNKNKFKTIIKGLNNLDTSLKITKILVHVSYTTKNDQPSHLSSIF